MTARAATRLLLTALLTGLVTTAPAIGQDRRSEVTATYLGLNQPAAVVPADGGAVAAPNTFRYVWPDQDKWLERAGRTADHRAALQAAGGDKNNPAVGVLNWTVPPTEFSTAGMDRDFRTFCAESPVRVVAGQTYQFEVLSPNTPQAYALPSTEAGNTESIRRATYIRELYGRYYVQALTDARAASAFQIALWEIIHENTWPEGQPAPLDLNGGSFRAAEKQDNPESVALATTYLKSLTGNDQPFYENESLASRELVWMKGLVSPAAANVFAQSQFALQYVRGGGTSPGAVAPVGAFGGGPGGFAPVGGGFGGTGPFGAFGSGIGALAGTGSPGSTAPGTTTTTTPPSTVVTPPTSPPVTTNPPPTQPPITVPPINEPPIETNPVPAPAGLVLGVIAIGAIAGRRALVRAARK